MITEEQLAEWEALATAATEGPWVEDDGNVFSEPLSNERISVIQRRLNGEDVAHPDTDRDNPLGWICSTEQGQPNFIADGDFICVSRTAIPELIAEVRRLRVLVKAD